MKKLLLVCLIFPCIAVSASEMTEDYFDIAANYATYGQYNDALVYINKILQEEPSNTDAQDVKAVLSRVINQYSKSYLTTTDKNIRDAQNYKSLGDKSKQTQTLLNATNDYWALYSLAQFYYDSEDYQNAINYYQKAASLKPDFSQCYLGLALSYDKTKDYDNALKMVNKYLTYNKEADIAFALRAEINMQLNNLSDAEKDIKQALDIEENISYLLTEAKIYYAKGDYDKAWEKFNLLSRNVQTSEVYKYLGLCDYALNNLSSALLNIDKAIILSDNDKELNKKYDEIKTALDKK